MSSGGGDGAGDWFSGQGVAGSGSGSGPGGGGGVAGLGGESAHVTMDDIGKDGDGFVATSLGGGGGGAGSSGAASGGVGGGGGGGGLDAMMMGGATGGAVGEAVATAVAGNVLKGGAASAQKFYSNYARIDLLRPYFDVEPAEVKQRLLRSFVPNRPGAPLSAIHSELYGPLMLVLTLVAVLLFDMKHSGHQVRDATLMGTALFSAFVYWVGASALLFSVAMACGTEVRFAQLLSLTGYGLLGHCVVLTVGSIHAVSSAAWFGVWCVVGGLSAARIATVLAARTPTRRRALVMAGVAFVIPWLHIYWLRWSFHHLVSGIGALTLESATHVNMAMDADAAGAATAVADAAPSS